MSLKLILLLGVVCLFLAEVQLTSALSLPDDIDACIILYDANSQKIIERHGGARCAERMPPCSTFKIPLALMGFDSGVLSDTKTIFAWDGKPKMLKSWEQDHDAKGWIRESVVWYSQHVAQLLGREKISDYLKAFDYGNVDMSGGLETAWLSSEPNPGSPVQSSIAISADEQLAFYQKLWSGQLPVSKRAIELTQEISFWETSPRGFTLYGKSGSGYAGKGTTRRLGWFIGRVKKGVQEIVGVVKFTDKESPAAGAGFAGPQAREIFKAKMDERGYW